MTQTSLTAPSAARRDKCSQLNIPVLKGQEQRHTAVTALQGFWNRAGHTVQGIPVPGLGTLLDKGLFLVLGGRSSWKFAMSFFLRLNHTKSTFKVKMVDFWHFVWPYPSLFHTGVHPVWKLSRFVSVVF